MGPVHAVFKADGDETRKRYSISEWWLEPYTRGPGAHTHEEDDVFFVIEGTMSFLVGGAWIDAPKGTLVIAPGGTAHDFENRTAKRAGALNLSVPGDFEPAMKGIAEWFRARSPAASRTANAPPRLNAAWHDTHPMPKKPTTEQRLAWHMAHQKHCSCRRMPAKLLKRVR
jgi:mannose-6-phosphate isomerase-like protein (cupin superfamily)